MAVSTEFECKGHATLVVKDRKGQRHCYNCIIESYQTRAYNLIAQMLGDWAAAEDVLQEVLLSGYKAFGSFRGDNLRAWLMRIAANAARDYLRSRKSRPAISLDYSPLNPEESDAPPVDVVSPDESPEDYALRQELGRAIQESLQHLPEERRPVLTLVDVQGYSYEEAAEICSCSLGTVKSRIARGRAEVRDYIQKYRELLPQQFRQND